MRQDRNNIPRSAVLVFYPSQMYQSFSLILEALLKTKQKKKRGELFSIVDFIQGDVILIETWLCAKVCDCELFDRLRKYNIYRNDR